MNTIQIFALITWMAAVYSDRIKIGTYNTYQIPSNPDALKFATTQLPLIGESNIDVLCLQELTLAATMQTYITALQVFGYTDSFSILDIYPSQNLATPRYPCNQQQIEALQSDCASNCNGFYDGTTNGAIPAGISWGVCLATLCPDDFDKILHSECSGCHIMFAGLHPTLSPELQAAFPLNIEGGNTFCSVAPQPQLWNLTEGTAIISKLPIINSWSYPLPSWLFIERRMNIVEIDVCSVTHKHRQRNNERKYDSDEDCKDSIIVGCTHQQSNGYLDETDIVQSPQLNNDNITSNIGLNRLQTQYIMDNIFNDDILETLGVQNNEEYIYGVFVMGDLNVGQLWNVCDYTADGYVADNCVEGVDEPLNPFDLWAQNGFIDAPDIKYIHGINVDVECTYCLDDTNEDEFNPLTPDEGIPATYIDDAYTTRDLDHIMVQNGYDHNFEAISLEREFMEKTETDVIQTNTEPTPVSDHYAVVLELKLKPERGGRCNANDENYNDDS